MKLNNQKRIAASISKVGKKRIKFDTSRSDEIKEAITKTDIRSLIGDKAIKVKPKRGSSKIRHRKKLKQKRKGRRVGQGSRKGKRTSRLSKKEAWISKIRIQRDFLKTLRDKKLIKPQVYRTLYKKSKGGFFRSKRHIKLYIEEQNLVKNGKK
jgi:large subunit ribosomal protein L19e